MRIEVICTGDEILSGKTINTNFAHISRRLQEVGMPVTWETTVGDDKEELIRAFRLAGDRADAVIVNGGLGPTQDDLSTPIAAECAGVGLVLHEARRIPEVGQEFVFHGFRFRILRRQRNQITLIRLSQLDKPVDA